MDLLNYPDQEVDFLEAMATYYKFTGKTYLVFTHRFLEINAHKNDKGLAEILEKQLLEGTKNGSAPEIILRDHLDKICTALEQDGCDFAGQTRGKWKIGKKWLREVKFPQWVATHSDVWRILWQKARETPQIKTVNYDKLEVLNVSWKKEPSQLPKIPLNSKIIYQLDLELDGYLILLDRFVSGDIYCLSPSFLNDRFYCEPGQLTIPDHREYPYLEVTGNLGIEQILAVITPDKPKVKWLHKIDEPYQLNNGDLNELLQDLEQQKDHQILRTQFQITAM